MLFRFAMPPVLRPPQQAEQAVVFYYTQNGFVILWPSTVLQFCVSPSPCATSERASFFVPESLFLRGDHSDLMSALLSARLHFDR